MALVENSGPDSVHFLKAGQFDVLNEGIKKEIEVFIASLTSIDKVVGGHTVIVIDLRPHGEKDLCCLLVGYFRNVSGCFTNFHNILEVRVGILEVVGGVNDRHVW